MALYRAEGIVLRTKELGEADRLLSIYTRQEGKVSAVARGARRTRSRLLGCSQAFTHCRFLFFRGRNLDTVSQAEMLDTFLPLRQDLMRMAYATYFCELIDALVEERAPQESLYRMLLVTFAVLSEEESHELLGRAFEVKVMALLGFRPQLASCLNCGAPTALGARLRFDPIGGGVLCQACIGAASQESLPISGLTVQWLWQLLNAELVRVKELQPGHAERREMERVMWAFITPRLSRRVQSRDFLLSLKDEPHTG